MKKAKIYLYAGFELNNKYYIFLDTYADYMMGSMGEYGRSHFPEELPKKMRFWHSLVDGLGFGCMFIFRAYIKNMKIVDNNHESYLLLHQHYTLEYQEMVDGNLHYGTMLEIEDKEIYEYKLFYIKTFLAISDLAPSNKR